MSNTPTPHNSAKLGDIAKTVFMSGDPLRAKMIAESYFENPVLYNELRGMLGYTGMHNGKMYSAQGHGMGIPSIGIYTYELYNFYDVDTIVRLGTCGAIDPNVKIGTVIIADEAISDSNYGYQFDLPSDYKPVATPELVQNAIKAADELGINYMVGTVFSSDVFYNKKDNHEKLLEKGVIGIEMESHALYINAFAAKKKALTILTVSDNIVTGESMPPEIRQKGPRDMVEIAFRL